MTNTNGNCIYKHSYLGHVSYRKRNAVKEGRHPMYSLVVGVVLFVMILSSVWFVAERLGIFEWIGNVVLKIKNSFKEEDKK
ncbi:hypothetical protein OCF65_11945 [Bacillus toyonensis]|uniref:hypothetical protein n=1 Tax=Bacillus toyonensis TaxID=155322 RepID=UPI001156C1E5|nr:hypothetical protein [Bacillus toyonensis]MCU5581198.1 hypothetical protein [Bacillus toyonensis]